MSGKMYSTITHATSTTTVKPRDTDKAILNSEEGKLALRIVKNITSKGDYTIGDITLLTLHQGMVAFLVNHLRDKENYGLWLNVADRNALAQATFVNRKAIEPSPEVPDAEYQARKLRVSTVNPSQGLVRSRPAGNVALLTDSQKLNVLLR